MAIDYNQHFLIEKGNKINLIDKVTFKTVKEWSIPYPKFIRNDADEYQKKLEILSI